MFSLRGNSSSSSDATAVPTPATSSPKFPIYLLPTFTIPFRSRRRQSSTATTATTKSYFGSSSPTTTTTDADADADAVPSLSSTPTSSALSSPVESPPTPSLFPTSSSRTTSTEENSRRSSGSGSGSVKQQPLDDDIPKLTQTQPDTIRCSTCAADFAFCSQIISKGFTGRFGRAYLVSAPTSAYPTSSSQHHHKNRYRSAPPGDLINIKVGKPETRLLVTGSHVVADISCAVCHTKVGWKYVDAKEEAQKYKVGKFILETQRCVDHRSWEDVPSSDLPEVEMRHRKGHDGGYGSNGDGDGDEDSPEAIVFDSDDEDECEDLFSGTWDPEIVAKRRSRKVNQRSARR